MPSSTLTSAVTLTPGQIWTFIIAMVGLILTILNIWDKIVTMKKNADAPIKDLQKRVTELEVKQLDQEHRLEDGSEIFKRQAKINKMFERVNLAFIDFEISYCNNTGYTETENLMKAKQLLEELLTNDEDW